MHVPTTGIAVALALTNLGRLVEARQRAAVIASQSLPHDAPAAFVAAHARAARLLAELDERTPLLRVAVRGGSPAKIEVDQDSLPPADAAAGFRVDAGSHVVQSTLPDGRTARVDVSLVERDERVVELAFAPAVVPVPPPTPARTGGEGPAPSPPRRDARVPWILAGASTAAAGLGLSLGAGYVALNDRNSAAAECILGRCPPASFNDIQAARTWSTVSTVSLAVAGAGAVTAIIALLVPRGTSDGTNGAGRVTPILGVTSVGAMVKF
jgi:hypothetical protein